MRIIGIDYGDARTGIAMTDALKITAQGLETIHNEGSDKKILMNRTAKNNKSYLRSIVRESPKIQPLENT